MHQHKKAAVNQREIGIDSDSFDRALRSALREDPDVMLVGEMRDPETIPTALTIAETGHLVFSTLHTNDAGQALDRIVDVFPGEQQAQIRVQLAGSLDRHRLPAPPAAHRRRAGRRVRGARRRPTRCATSSARARPASCATRERPGRKYGMQTLERSSRDLVTSGVVDYEEAISHSLFPDEITRAARLAQEAAPGRLTEAAPGRSDHSARSRVLCGSWGHFAGLASLFERMYREQSAPSWPQVLRMTRWQCSPSECHESSDLTRSVVIT